METTDFYRNMLDNVYEGIYFVDAHRQITFWNKGAERITGFLSDEVVGKHCYNNILNHVDGNGKKLCIEGCPLYATIQDGILRNAEVYLHHKDGHRVAVNVRTTPFIEDGKITGAIEIFISENEEFLTNYHVEELKILAYRDQLTNLPNRRFLDKTLAEKLQEYEETGSAFGLAIIDIDHFKMVNDTYGHLNGDNVLKMIGKTFLASIRATDIVGRWGGEEFLVLLDNVNLATLASICEKIRMLSENSVLRTEESGEVHVTVSVGGTLSRVGDTVSNIIERADKMLYHCKNNGRNQVSLAE